MSDGVAAADGRATGPGTASDGRPGTRGSATYRDLFRVVGRKRLALLVRYPVNTIAQVGTLFMIFTVVFVGGRAVSAQALDDSLGGIVVGFFLYSLALMAFSGLSWNVIHESQWGTLEQLYMSPFGFGRVMFVSLTVRVLESFLWGGITLAFMLVVTGETLALNVVTVLVLSVLALLPAIGLGFAFGGLAMVYKRVENAFQLMNFVFVGLVAAPASGIVWARLLPVSQGTYLLSMAMQENRRLWELPAGDLALLVGVGVGYFAAGYGVFAWMTRRARREGLMGHY